MCVLGDSVGRTGVQHSLAEQPPQYPRTVLHYRPHGELMLTNDSDAPKNKRGVDSTTACLTRVTALLAAISVPAYIAKIS